MIVWFSFVDSYSLTTRWELSNKKEDLKARTEQLNKDSKELIKKIESLKEDTALLEKIAREEYGMRKTRRGRYTKIRREE